MPASKPGPLAAHALALLALSLAVFNLYLAAWVWSGLRAIGQEPGGGPSVRFPGRLTSRKSFQADRVLARQEEHQVALEAQEDQEIQIQIRRIGAPRGEEDNRGQSALLRLRANGSLAFPSGLIVGARATPGLRCARECHVRAPLLRLGHLAGVDFGAKSVQAKRVSARRLHSASGRLALLSTAGVHLEAARGLLRMRALDDVALSSRGQVTLAARQIELRSFRRGPAEGPAKSYKLCICLDRNRQANGTDKRPAPVGLVFAVRPQLSCARFSAALCNAAAHAEMLQWRQTI